MGDLIGMCWTYPGGIETRLGAYIISAYDVTKQLLTVKASDIVGGAYDQSPLGQSADLLTNVNILLLAPRNHMGPHLMV